MYFQLSFLLVAPLLSSIRSEKGEKQTSVRVSNILEIIFARVNNSLFFFLMRQAKATRAAYFNGKGYAEALSKANIKRGPKSGQDAINRMLPDFPSKS